LDASVANGKVDWQVRIGSKPTPTTWSANIGERGGYKPFYNTIAMPQKVVGVVNIVIEDELTGWAFLTVNIS
jgi:hypothetical protein